MGGPVMAQSWDPLGTHPLPNGQMATFRYQVIDEGESAEGDYILLVSYWIKTVKTKKTYYEQWLINCSTYRAVYLKTGRYSAGGNFLGIHESKSKKYTPIAPGFPNDLVFNNNC
jgi:hypothetical protein